MAVQMKTASQAIKENARLARAALSVRIKKRLGTGFHLSVDLTLEPGIAIVFGASGAGKTTLLNCVAGLTLPDSGRIELGQHVWFDSQEGIDVPVSRRRTGYVFQTLALFPHLTVEHNVQYGLSSLPAEERKHRIGDILESFHIADVARRKPAEISGGERQRVALARSLVTDPRLLLLDEPLVALDAAVKAKIVTDLRTWNSRHGIPIIYVTHSREEVFALGERVVVLDGGEIIADGTPHQVIRAPRQETLAQLAGFENIFNARVIAVHEDRGTLTCHLDHSSVELETPVVAAQAGTHLRVAISAGDILLASVRPTGLSARNVLAGKIISVDQRDVMVMAAVDCGVELQVQLTLAARDALQLRSGTPVWLIIKTHSCHLLAV